MFGTFRKHSTALWVVIIIVIIFAFILWDMWPNLGGGPAVAVAESVGTIDGEDIPLEEYYAAKRDAGFAFLFVSGQWPGRNPGDKARWDQETRYRLFMLRKAREFGIEVSDEAVAGWIANSGVFNSRQTGAFDKQGYDNFVSGQLPSQGLSEAEFIEYARGDIAIQQLQGLISASGRLVTPAEAEQAYRDVNQQYVTEMVPFLAADFMTNVVSSNENLSRYYTNNRSRYVYPDRVVVRFVKFDFTNYTDAAEKRVAALTNLQASLESVYAQRGASYYTDTNTVPLPKEAALLKIREEVAREFAQREARQAAGLFMERLEDSGPVKAENLETVAAAEKLTVMESQPFSEFEGPSDLAVMDNFSRQAFALTAEEPFGGPLPGNDAVFVIALKQRIPGGELPPMETKLQQVMEDYLAQESESLARAAGQKFAAMVKDGAAAKESFAAVAAADKRTVITLPSFTMATRALPEIERYASLFELQSAVRSLEPGQFTGFMESRNGGFVLHLKERLPADESRMKEEMPAFIEQLRRSRQSEVYEQWMLKASQGVKLVEGLP